MKFKIKPGISKAFFKLLVALYKPLLSTSHLKDRYQFTIYNDKNKPIGIVQLNKDKNKFIQIALISKYRKKRLAKRVILSLAKKLNYDRIDWSASKLNYPSLKLLYDLGGGLFKNSLKNKTYEGFFRPGKIVNKEMRDALKSVLPQSKKFFKKWLKIYKTRKKEFKKLRVFLKRLKVLTEIYSDTGDGQPISAYKFSDTFINNVATLLTIAKEIEHLVSIIKEKSSDLNNIYQMLEKVLGKLTYIKLDYTNKIKNFKYIRNSVVHFNGDIVSDDNLQDAINLGNTIKKHLETLLNTITNNKQASADALKNIQQVDADQALFVLHIWNIERLLKLDRRNVRFTLNMLRRINDETLENLGQIVVGATKNGRAITENIGTLLMALWNLRNNIVHGYVKESIDIKNEIKLADLIERKIIAARITPRIR